jgi:hypothetical protein
MLRYLVPVYSLVVSFCCLMCLIVALGICAYDVVRVAWPEFTVGGSNWQSTEQVIAYHPDKKDASPEELQQFKQELHLQSLASERHAAAQGLVFSGIIVLIDAVVYALHWNIARKAISNAA